MIEVVETIGKITGILVVIRGCVWMNHKIRLANFEHAYGYTYKKRRRHT